MFKKVVIGTAALMLAASAYAYAQQPNGGRDGGGRFQLSAEDRAAFLDARLAALHAGLKLTPDQEKSWPGFEQAYRSLAASRAEAMNTFRNRDREPIARRSDHAGAARGRFPDQARRCAQAVRRRAAPLYSSLDDGQKQRFEILSRIGRPRFAFFGWRSWRSPRRPRRFPRSRFHGGDFRGDRDGFRGEYRGNIPTPRDFR